MTMSRFIYEPPTALRGSRDYVHSTDIYEEIVNGAVLADLGFDGPVDLRIRRKIMCRPRYVYFPAGEAVGEASVICSFKSGGVGYVAAVTETADPVMVLKQYDETPAARISRIEGRTARLDGETGLRPIEAVTALAVHLHKAALPPAAGKRWMLVQLSIRRPLAETETKWLGLYIDKLVGTTMTRTRIDAHDGPLGTMIFMLATSDASNYS